MTSRFRELVQFEGVAPSGYLCGRVMVRSRVPGGPPVAAGWLYFRNFAEGYCWLRQEHEAGRPWAKSARLGDAVLSEPRPYQKELQLVGGSG